MLHLAAEENVAPLYCHVQEGEVAAGSFAAQGCAEW